MATVYLKGAPVYGDYELGKQRNEEAVRQNLLVPDLTESAASLIKHIEVAGKPVVILTDDRFNPHLISVFARCNSKNHLEIGDELIEKIAEKLKKFFEVTEEDVNRATIPRVRGL